MTAYDAAGWGGFGTTAATAAATLTGLLFIAVSINLKEILDNAPLPGRAAQRPLTRVVPMAVSGACVIVAGVSEVAGAGGGLYWLVPATVLAILAGLVNTWVLLVEIMR